MACYCFEHGWQQGEKCGQFSKKIIGEMVETVRDYSDNELPL